MKRFCLTAVAVCFLLIANAQNQKGITVFGTIYGNDTIPLSYLEPVVVKGYVSSLTEQEQKKYSKLIRNTKKTYPIAKQAQQLINSYSVMMNKAQNDSQKDKIRKQAFNDLKFKFQEKTKNLNKEQSVLLSKLIYRQTGFSSYELIKDFGGGVKATMAKTTAKAMGISLKEKFDAQNNEQDRITERIIYCIEAGKL
ncbi:MAG: DUF4294 domain-containing protein [Bacteroidales bacterium]|nr:DUF4294 domain-containing protein [Bacteroidales bacterium]